MKYIMPATFTAIYATSTWFGFTQGNMPSVIMPALIASAIISSALCPFALIGVLVGQSVIKKELAEVSAQERPDLESLKGLVGVKNNPFIFIRAPFEMASGLAVGHVGHTGLSVWFLLIFMIGLMLSMCISKLKQSETWKQASAFIKEHEK